MWLASLLEHLHSQLGSRNHQDGSFGPCEYEWFLAANPRYRRALQANMVHCSSATHPFRQRFGPFMSEPSRGLLRATCWLLRGLSPHPSTHTPSPPLPSCPSSLSQLCE